MNFASKQRPSSAQAAPNRVEGFHITRQRKQPETKTKSISRSNCRKAIPMHRKPGNSKHSASSVKCLAIMDGTSPCSSGMIGRFVQRQSAQHSQQSSRWQGISLSIAKVNSKTSVTYQRSIRIPLRRPSSSTSKQCYFTSAPMLPPMRFSLLESNAVPMRRTVIRDIHDPSSASVAVEAGLADIASGSQCDQSSVSRRLRVEHTGGGPP
jgi:hypothetical protein